MRRASVRVVRSNDGASAPYRTRTPAVESGARRPRTRLLRVLASASAALLALPLLLPVAGPTAAGDDHHDHAHPETQVGGMVIRPSAPDRSRWSMGEASTDASWTLRWPVAGSSRISQYYRSGRHYAIDIAARSGTSVVAARSGRVTFAGWKNNGGGYQVWISHGSGRYTTYNHMRSYTVRRGQSVSRGQRVGRVGSTGNSTGPHLHFELWLGPIWNGGRRVNPLRYMDR